MPKFNWKDKTGISEIQWLQMITAVITAIAAYYDLHELAMHAGLLASFALGGVGVYLRRKDKSNQSSANSRLALAGYAMNKATEKTIEADKILAAQLTNDLDEKANRALSEAKEIAKEYEVKDDQ